MKGVAVTLGTAVLLEGSRRDNNNFSQIFFSFHSLQLFKLNSIIIFTLTIILLEK